MRHRVPRGEEQALHVDAIDPVELLLGHVEQRLVAVRRARVVDDDVEVAIGVERAAHEGFDVGVARDVTRTERRGTAGRGDSERHALRTRRVDVVDDDLRTLLREALRDAGAEAGPGAGHDGDLARAVS